MTLHIATIQANIGQGADAPLTGDYTPQTIFATHKKNAPVVVVTVRNAGDEPAVLNFGSLAVFTASSATIADDPVDPADNTVTALDGVLTDGTTADTVTVAPGAVETFMLVTLHDYLFVNALPTSSRLEILASASLGALCLINNVDDFDISAIQ